jgi:NADH dehydrogenase (ubiquinone) 1 alpha subcomplex subunit 9
MIHYRVSVYVVLSLWPVCKRNFTYDDVHIQGAGRIAKVSASVGVPRLVHVSHLNSSPTSASQFYRSKAASESAVREAFPAATIVRPGPMYGHEDKFLTNMSSTSPARSLPFPFLTTH